MSISVEYNKITMIGTIDFKLANQFIDKFEIALSVPSDNVELHISSPGGIVEACELVCNTIQLSYKPVDIYISNGKGRKDYPGVASGASVISQFCRKKVMDHNSTFLIHHSRSGRRIRHDVEDIYFWMERTGLDYETVKNLLLSEPKLSADTALNLGFIDEIQYK